MRGMMSIEESPLKPKPFLQKFHYQTNIFNYFMLLDSDFGKNEICDFNYLSFLFSGLKLQVTDKK